MKNTIEKYNVSRETYELLKRYESSLSEWQQKMNLVSRNSLVDAWKRHFLDSMQLFSLLPQGAKVVYDFGSGAGFPGMVLAVMAKEKTPYLKFKLVESIKKKTLYLNAVKELTGANVEIINDRIENIEAEKRVTPKVTVKVTANQKKIIDAIKTNPFIPQEELADIVGIARKNIVANMKKLQKSGLIKRIGADKNKHWKIEE